MKPDQSAFIIRKQNGKRSLENAICPSMRQCCTEMVSERSAYIYSGKIPRDELRVIRTTSFLAKRLVEYINRRNIVHSLNVFR